MEKKIYGNSLGIFTAVVMNYTNGEIIERDFPNFQDAVRWIEINF